MALGASTRFIDNTTDLDAAAMNTLDGGLNVYHSPNGGLNFRLTAGTVWLSGKRTEVAAVASDQAVSPSSTTYVFLDGDGSLTTNTTGFPTTTHLPLAEITSDGSTITAIADRRPRIGIPLGGPSRLWRASYYYTNAETPPDGTNLTLTADTLYAIPFTIARDQAVDRIAVEVTTLSGGSSVRLGLYAEHATTRGLPGDLLEDLGTISGATTGIKALTISGGRRLPPGLYFVAVIASDGTVAFRQHTQAAIGGQFGWDSGAASDFAAGSANTMWRGTNGANAAASALPTPFPSATGVNAAQVAAFLRAA